MGINIANIRWKIGKKLFNIPENVTWADNAKVDLIKGAQLTAIGQFDPQDLFIIGYPRSGHTWFQALAAGIMYGIDTELAPPQLINTVVPDVHVRTYYTRVSTPMFFKSHFLPKPEYKRVIYLLRDGRDAMVSYYHFTKALEHKPNLDFLELVRSVPGRFPGSWNDHVEQWLKNPYQAQIQIVRYEELLAKPVETLKTCCDYFGIERDTPFLERVVKQAEFSKMKTREAKMGWANKQWPAEEAFIRRGIAGSFKDEMPPEVLQEFLRQAGDTMRKVGYATS
jgi:hypothetical protein